MRRRSPRRQRLARLSRLSLASGLVLLAGPTLAPAAQAAPRVTVAGVPTFTQSAARAPQAADDAPADAHASVQVTLNTVSPAAPAPDGDVTLSGVVTNRAAGAVNGLHVGVTYGRQMSSRSDIESIASAGGPQQSDPSEIDDPSLQDQIGTLAPGASASFSLKVPISKLQLGSSPDGVYSVGVDAQNANGAALGTLPLGITRTFLPVHPSSDTAKPTQVATLWPVTDAPTIQAQTYVDSNGVEQPVLTNDLATSLGPDGRLGQLASIGTQNANLHLTWVVNPDLIDTVYAMTNDYQVLTGGDTGGANATCNCVRKGSGQDAAKAWLTAMQQALAAGKPEVVSLPYADPDLASLAHSSTGRQQLSALLPLANTSLGLDRLQVDAEHDVAWPYQGYVDTSVASLAKSMGADKVIVNGASMPDSGNLNFTPNAARPMGDGMTAVVADNQLTDIFSGDLSTQSEQTAATQRFLAETLEITLERPDQQRDVLVQPPREMSTATAQTLVKALSEAQGGKWVQSVNLDDVVNAGATPGANTSVPAPHAYPSSARGSELSGSTINDLSTFQGQLSQLQQILTRPDRLRDPFSAAMVRSVSTAWRDNPAAGDSYRANMGGYLGTLQDSVRLIPKITDVVVPGDNSSATVAVSVENDLEQTVSKMQLRLIVEQSPRLRIDSDPVQDVTVAGGRTKTTYRFRVTALANGTVDMKAELSTAQNPDAPFDFMTFQVNVTSVSTGVIAVIASGGLLLVLAGLRLYWKRKKNAALAAASSEGPEPENAE
ncbi:DUF6049 family protein [Streptacidiphilus sp. MAP5-3]|uniref:DUF6049 family protein n=1 Tax=unclassified Streptacidiphilus TaxID=2643834 RepID=UPI003517C072